MSGTQTGGWLTDPPSRGFVITPADGADLAIATNGIYVGVSGDVRVDFFGTGTGITLKSVPVGYLPIRVKRVYATGTTATNLVGML